MSELGKLVEQIVTELKDNKQSGVQDLLESIHSLLDVLPIAAALGPAQNLNLLQGLLFADPDLEFFKRLKTQEEQKRNLAKYCMEKCELDEQINSLYQEDSASLDKYFFESGSTIAHLIGLFAISISDARTHSGDPENFLNSTVLTNNLTGLTALGGLVKSVEPAQGRLSMKYFGFFPFGEDDPTSKAQWREEGKRFNLLAEDIESCEFVFATCSNFSFIGGPVVGTRDNCLTKRAMYSGAVRWGGTTERRFYLLLHFEKLVPILNSYQYPFEEPKMSCGCVFALPNDDTCTALSKFRDEIDDENSIHSIKTAGTWHEKIRTKNKSNDIQIPIERFKEETSRIRVRVRHNLLQSSWAEWLQHSEGVIILISLPVGEVKKAASILKEEIFRVNLVFQLAEVGFEYKIVNENSIATEKVARIEIVRL